MPDIIVGDTRPFVQYTADGTQAVFAFPFPVLAAEDLVVVFDDGLSPAPHLITGLGESGGGSVTFEAPPPAGTRITLYRDMPVARTADFTEAGTLRASALNTQLDRLAMMAQQVEAAGRQALRRAPHDPDVDLTLPPQSARANGVLTFDASGRPTALIAPDKAAENAAASAEAAAASAADAADAAATAATEAAEAAAETAATAALAEVRRRGDLAVQRMFWRQVAPSVAPQPVWAVDGVLGLGLDLLSVSRPGPATYIDARGRRVTAGPDTPRLDHDPVTGEALGLLIESARTNLLHDSFNPVTQTRSLAADTYTLSLDGGGEVAVSGAASGTATAEAPLTFTLGAAGDVTFTPSGEVTAFQCEAGGNATSPIETPVDGSATRPADNVTALDIDWLSRERATVVIEAAYPDIPTVEGSRLFSLDDGTDGNRHTVFWNQGLAKVSWFTKTGGASQGSVSVLQDGWGGDGARHTFGLRYVGGERTLMVDRRAAASDTVAMPTGLTTLRLGAYHFDQQQWRGHIRRVAVWNTALTQEQFWSLAA
jgi:hypothetical protein